MRLVTGMVVPPVIDTLPSNVFAAKEIQKEDTMKMNSAKIGNIVTSRTMPPMDARRDLSKEANELGGKYFVVIIGQKNEKIAHASADVYKQSSHERRAYWSVFHC